MIVVCSRRLVLRKIVILPSLTAQRDHEMVCGNANVGGGEGEKRKRETTRWRKWNSCWDVMIINTPSCQ